MRFDAVVIGAGLGGLSAGAFLSAAGKSVLVLEKSLTVGGRCRSVELMGHSFDIGADYFGRKMLKSYAELGKRAAVMPVPFRTLAHTDGGNMTLPPGPHTIGDLGRLGLTASEMLRLGYRMGRQLLTGPAKGISSNINLINHMTENPHLRDILNIGAFFSGNDPENMPSYWFNLLFGNTYGYNRPFYPRGGSGALAALLAEVIKEHNGGIVFDSTAESIVIDGGRARGVRLDGRTIEAENVISGISIIPTVHRLAGKEHFPSSFLDTIGYYKEGLAMASVFVVFGRKAGITKGVHIYARFARNLRAMFRVLGEGRFPDKSMFILSCPDAAVGTDSENIAGTVKFLVPKGVTDRAEIEAEAKKVLKDVDTVVPGFHASIVDSMLYTPEDYAREFGFVSQVTPVAESVNYEKLSCALPVDGLYCVGSTVLPAGGCAASSMASGKLCAQDILKYSAG